MVPKGKLIIIGGAEDKGEGKRPAIVDENADFKSLEILSELVPTGKSENAPIEVITTASQIPDEVMADYKKTFKKLGAKAIGHINIQNKEQAEDNGFIDRINKAHAVFFSGGDQFRLSTILLGTQIMEAIQHKYNSDKNFILAGTSAGAMAMSKVMMWEGSNNEAMLKGDVKMSSGFGFLDNAVVDTHFVRRGRIGRLTLALIMNPSCIGIGLGEDTALIIRNGNEATCLGSGMVMILDGSEVCHTNVAEVDDRGAICVEKVILHILTSGNGFLLDERKFVRAKKKK